MCSRCLNDEFAAAPMAATPEVAEVVAQNLRVQKRQSIRAERMARELKSDSPFGLLGMLRCGLSIVLFLLCMIVFMIGANPHVSTPINQLECEYQYVVSVGCSLVCVALLLPSFNRHRVAVSLVSLVLLVVGSTMPLIWNADRTEEDTPAAEAAPEPVVNKKAAQAPVRVAQGVLTRSDLAEFLELCRSRPQQAHYAIYLSDQNSSTRTLVRESLTRLLRAELTQAYTRAEGALYVAVNARRPRSEVARVAARYGNVVFSNLEAGVYEVEFDAEKTNLVSPYSSEVLTNPRNPDFVVANISELLCLEPMRVSAAANALETANVQILRRDIRDAVLQALRDPWDAEEETYQSLVKALVVYAPQGDAESVTALRTYFDSRRSMQKSVSPVVVRRLIAEQPEEMVEPIVQLWFVNPLVWNEMISALGSRAEELLLPKLQSETDLQMLDAVLKYLDSFGTMQAVPTLERLNQHPDSLIRHKAENTLQSIRKRHAD